MTSHYVTKSQLTEITAVTERQFSSAECVRQGELLQRERVRHGQVQLPVVGRAQVRRPPASLREQFPGEGDTVSVKAVQYSTLYSALQHIVAARYIINRITALH